MGVVVMVGIILLVPVWADADIPGAKESIEFIRASLAEIQVAEKGGEEGRADDLSDHADRAIPLIEKASKAMPLNNPHGREADSLLKEAVIHLQAAVGLVETRNGKRAVSHVSIALDFVDAALMHVEHGE